MELLAAACIIIACRQGEVGVGVHTPSEPEFHKVTGFTVRIYCAPCVRARLALWPQPVRNSCRDLCSAHHLPRIRPEQAMSRLKLLSSKLDHVPPCQCSSC